MQVPTQLSTPFLFQPVISLTEAGTDNVNGTGTSDLISTIALNLNLLEQTRYTQLAASGSVNYQSFLNTSSLDNGGVSGSGNGTLILWRDVLSIDANGAVSDQFTDQFDVPATNRATNQPRVRLTSFDAGPHVSANIDNLLDVDARARYAQVDFQSLGTTVLPAGLTTAHINQAVGRISTSQYIRPYQMVVSGEVLTQDGGFELYNGLYSLFLGSTESFQLVGRIGYESTFDPGVTDVKGLIWSGGFVAHPGTQGYIRVEFGSRYHKPTWDARILYPITPSIVVTGAYLRTFETQQTRIQRSLTGITDLNIDQPFGTPGLPAAFISPDLIGATFLSDDASLAADWRLNQSTSVQIVGAYTHRHVFTDNTDDSSFATSVGANRSLSSKLRVLATFGVDKALSVRLGGPRPWDYRASVSAEYTVSKLITASLILARTEVFDSGSAAPSENVVELTLVRSF